jgi:hypothetical protein
MGAIALHNTMRYQTLAENPHDACHIKSIETLDRFL